MADLFTPAEDKIEELVEAALRDRLVIFVGAGVSRNSGLPTWDELLKAVMGDWPEGLLEVGKVQPLQLIQAFVQKCRGGSSVQVRQDLAAHILVSEANAALSEAHTQLQRLPVAAVYTTNYDTLLEKAFTDSPSLATDDDFASSRPVAGVSDIIHLHGSIRSPLSMRVTWADFIGFWNDRRRHFLRNRVEYDLHTKTFLFLGYGFRDLHLLALFQEFANLPGQSEWPHYAVFLMPQAPSVEDEAIASSLAALNLKTLTVPNPDGFAGFLRELADQVDSRSRESGKRETPTAATAMAHELTNHIKQDDVKVMADYIERGEYEEAINYTDRLLERIRRIRPRDDEVRGSESLLVSKKIAYLLLNQQDSEARDLLRRELAREPTSPWLVAERLRELLIDNNVNEAVALLARVPREDRANVVLFDLFEFHMFLGQKQFERAKSLLRTSEALKSEKHNALKRTMQVSLHIQRRDIQNNDPSYAAKQIVKLKQEVDCSIPVLRGKRPSKSDVYELYSQSVISYLLVSPPAPYLSGDYRPLEDFGVSDYRELLIAARVCVEHLMRVVKDRRMLDDLHLRNNLLSHWLDRGLSAMRRDKVQAPELPSGDISSALEAFFQARQHVGDGEHSRALDVLGAINWPHVVRRIPFSVRLDISVYTAYAMGLLDEEVDAHAADPLAQLLDATHLLGDCDRQDFVVLGSKLLRSAQAMGRFNSVGAAADELASILESRPYSLRWLYSIIELLEMFAHEARRQNVPGFFKMFSLSDLEVSPGIPDRVSKRLWSGESLGVDSTDVTKVKTVMSNARRRLYELLPNGGNLLACADNLLNIAPDFKPCREFLGNALKVDWPRVFDWSKVSLPSIVQELELTEGNIAALLFYLGKCAPSHDQAISVLERAHGMAKSAGSKDLASHIAFDLARLYMKRDEKDRTTNAFERCLETSSSSHHYLAFAASLIGDNQPQRAWETLEKGCRALGESRELIQPMFQLGFRLGNGYERSALEILQRHPEYFGARRLDIHKEKDEIIAMLDDQRRAEQKEWEYYSWGKRPLVAVAENRGSRLTSVWSRLTRIQRVLLFRWPDPERHRFEHGVVQQQQSEFVLDISAILTIAELGISEQVSGMCAKAVCSNSLWDFVHQEVLATGQAYREARHRSHQRFQAWLGDSIQEIPTATEYWQKTGVKLVTADSPEQNGLGYHVISLAWAREKQGLWLAIHQPDNFFEDYLNWSESSKRALLFPTDLVELLGQWGEITSAQKARLDKVLNRMQVFTPHSVQTDVAFDRLEHIEKGAPLGVSYHVFEFLEEVMNTEGIDLLPIMKRCFSVTISPIDLQEFQQELAQHDADWHACQLAQKTRDVIRQWRQRGFLEVVEPKIRETPDGEYASVEHLGVPFTEFALATEKQLPLVVDDLGTFEVFHGLLRRSGVGKTHPTTGIPLFVLRGIHSSTGDERSFWFDKMRQLWLWGIYGLPPSGVLAWLLEQTNWNTQARPVRDLMQAMTQLVQFRPPSEALTEKDMSEIGVSFTAGIPDPQVTGRLSLFSLVKELARATLIYCISNKRLAESSQAGGELSLKPLVDLRLEVELIIRQLEETILRNGDVRRDTNDNSIPQPGLFSQLLPMMMLSSAQMPETEMDITDVRFGDKQFLCDCVAKILLQGSEYLSPQLAREALLRAIVDKSRITEKKCKKEMQDYEKLKTYEKYISALVAIRMFLETVILLPSELTKDIQQLQPSLEKSFLESWGFIRAEELKKDLKLPLQKFAELESIRLPTETLLLHLAQQNILGFSPDSEVVTHCIKCVEQLCGIAKENRTGDSKVYELAMLAISKSFDVMPDQVRTRFFSVHKLMLNEIGISIKFPSETFGLSDVLNGIRAQIEKHMLSLLEKSEIPVDRRADIARSQAAFLLADIELALGDCATRQEAENVILSLLQQQEAPNLLRATSLDFTSTDLEMLGTVVDSAMMEVHKTLSVLKGATDNATGVAEGHSRNKLLASLRAKFVSALAKPSVLNQPERFSLLLRRAIHLVSLEITELGYVDAALIDGIMKLGAISSTAWVRSSLFEETELLLHLLRGRDLVRLDEWRRELKRIQDEE